MRINRKPARAILLLFIIILLLFNACSRPAAFSDTISEISDLSQAAGFLAAKVAESGGFIAGTDQKEKTSDYAYLYDNAIAAVVLSYVGAQQLAESIADAIVFVQSHDRSFQDGRLRNVYIAGDPRSDSGRSIAAGKVTIRLPGFWQDGRWQEDYYTVSTSTGNMAWVIMALCAAAENASEKKQTEYLDAAMQAADFVLTLADENVGFVAGYEGWDDAQIRASYLSTEHNIDLYAAFSGISAAVSDRYPDRAEVYKEAAGSARDFVMSMFDEPLCCFYAGTTEDGKTISDGVIPLDTNSLAILALGSEMDDAYRTLSFVEERMTVGRGFDFSAGDLDGVWNEGTAQMAVCYNILGNTEKYESVMDYLKTQTFRDGSIPAADRDGVSTGFVIVGSETPWEYHNNLSISATGWLALAQLCRNPFERAAE